MLKNVTFLGMLFPSLKDSGHRLAFSDLTFFIFHLHFWPVCSPEGDKPIQHLHIEHS